jgi:hypothetical protein
MSIALEIPEQSEVARLIEDLDVYQRPLYPPESHHGLDIAAMSQPNALFAVARDKCNAAVGCGANLDWIRGGACADWSYAEHQRLVTTSGQLLTFKPVSHYTN